METPPNSPDHRFDDEAASGGSFVVGLLAGTVLGAGLAMIFGPTASLASRETASGGASPSPVEARVAGNAESANLSDATGTPDSSRAAD